MLLHFPYALWIMRGDIFLTLSMKHLTSYATSALFASQMLVSRVFAQGDLTVPDVPGLPDPGGGDIIQAIVALITAILDFVLILAVVFVIVAGIRLIVSGGDEGQKDTAKKTIIYVVAGILVILLARVLVVFVAGIFG